MVKRLRLRITLLAAAVLLAVLVGIIATVNIINYHSVSAEADRVLDFLSGERGHLHSMGGGREDAPLEGDEHSPTPPPGMSPEVPYEARYFTVTENGDGSITADVSHIRAVDEAAAKEYAAQAVSERGFIDSFRYKFSNDGKSVMFLDRGRALDGFRSFLYTSIAISALGFILLCLVIFLLAGRITAPIAESYEKQKRFITDAGHEIKTPLAIIGANLELLSMEVGKLEALDDIKTQTDRLAGLTEELVYLARLEEDDRAAVMVDFPLSEVVEEAATAFRAVAEREGRELDIRIEKGLSLYGDSSSITKLTTILIDNAIKYSTEGARISLMLIRQGRSVVISAKNPSEATGEEQLSHVFDRFWRADPSRSSAVSGHGIGLSVAKAITESHNGKIKAYIDEQGSFTVTVTLPEGSKV